MRIIVIKRTIFVLAFLIYSSCGFVLAQDQNQDGDILRLSIDDVSALALYNNLDIQIVRYDAYAKRTDLLGAESIFDTILSAKITYEDDQLKPASTIPGTKSLSAEYGIGLSKLMPTGTTLNLEVNDERNWSNSPFVSTNPYHDTSLGFSIKQSLGKNFFGRIDRGNIKVTKLEIKASDFASLDKIEGFLASVQEAYWNLVLRKEELKIKKEMLERAKRLRSIYRDKFSIGLVEDPEIFAVEVLVLKREADLLTSYDLVNFAKDDLLLEINADEESFQMAIDVEDELSFAPERQDFLESLKEAIGNRRDYEEARLKLEAKKINLEMKKNNLWPQIDLDASFKRNGLDNNFTTAYRNILDEDNPKVFFGLTFKLPLENRQAKAGFRLAEINKAKQIVALKKVEKKIVSSVHTKVREVNLAIGKVITKKRVLKLEKKKLAAENLRFSFGRSNSDILIRYQEDLLLAKLEILNSIFDYKTALIDLERETNVLLDKYWTDEL